jgi:hypothetical protein
MKYAEAEVILKGQGWQVWKHIDEDSYVDGLEVQVSPILLSETADKIRGLLPASDFKISEVRSQKYVLIKKIYDKSTVAQEED